MSTPYDTYKNTDEWLFIKKVMQELMDDKDIQLSTSQDYVIGYITKQLMERSSNNLKDNEEN